MKYLLLPKLSSGSISHQLSPTETRSYYKHFVDFILLKHFVDCTHEVLSITHSITKKYKFINIILKTVETSFYKRYEILPNFLRFAQISNKSKPPAPIPQRPVERGKLESKLHSGSSKVSDNPVR